MPSAARLRDLIALLDDEDADVRAAVVAQLETYGPALDAELARSDIRLDAAQRTLIRTLLRDGGRRRLLAAWPGWSVPADDYAKLEGSLALLSEYQIGRVAEGALGRQLDALARDYADLTTVRDGLDLARYLFRERGLHGAEEDYYNPLNSSLVHVLTTKKGLPISLVCIFMLVGNRLGVRVEGCNFPGHFLAFVPRGPVKLIVDCFDGGRVMDMRALAALNPALNLEGGDLKKLECTAETIVARTLRNLSNAYRQLGESTESAFMEELIGRLSGADEGSEEA